MRIADRSGYKADANGAEFVGILEKRRDRFVFGAAIVYPFRHLRVRWNRAAMMINNQSYAEGRLLVAKEQNHAATYKDRLTVCRQGGGAT